MAKVTYSAFHRVSASHSYSITVCTSICPRAGYICLSTAEIVLQRLIDWTELIVTLATGLLAFWRQSCQWNCNRVTPPIGGGKYRLDRKKRSCGSFAWVRVVSLRMLKYDVRCF